MMKYLKNWRGLLYGITYGLVSRGIFALEDFRTHEYGKALFPTYGLMTISFMFLVPFVIGLLTAYHHDHITSSRKIAMLTMPFFAILGLVGISVIFGQEGIICALMALPVFLFMALLGGFIGVNLFPRNRGKIYVSILMFLPFLVSPIENHFGLSTKIFTEHTTIVIHSTTANVWQNITRVRQISQTENRPSLFQWMGFPRPLEAELDTVAVGGIRKAIFDRGLFFTETVTEMEPLKVLAFTIKADPNSIPPAALDAHVMVGGKYFDVLEGRYEIEKLDNHRQRLHLTSQFRLSTMFNFYSGFWSKLIMRDIQKNILEIVKQRSEATSKTALY